DPDSPFFTTDRFDGHLSVLVRAKDLRAISRTELTELIQDAWLSRASKRRADLWLAEQGRQLAAAVVVDSSASERRVGLRYPTSNTKLNASTASSDPRARGSMWMV